MTVKTCLLESFEKHSSNLCLGQREKIAQKTEEGEIVTFGKYKWMTYQQVKEYSIALAKFIAKENICPEVDEYKNQKLKFMGIYSGNREEWMLTYLSCIFSNIVTVSLYTALSDNGIDFIAQQTNLSTIALERNKIGHILKLKEQGMLKNVWNFLCFDEPTDEEIVKCSEQGIFLFYILKCAEKGDGLDIELEDPSFDSIVTINYTSGTTGTPKGAIATHQSYIAKILAGKYNYLDTTEADCLYSYLPLAHWFENLVEIAILNSGASIGYTCGNIQKIIEDVQVLQPTIFAAVPRILNRIRDKITSQFNEKKGLAKRLINMAIRAKMDNVARNGISTHMIYDRLVFNKVKNVLGGKIRVMACGAAPLSQDTFNFIRILFCCKLFQGYGLTEANGGAISTDPQDTQVGHVGGPALWVEYKLVDVPEMEYHSTDEIDGVPHPRGEICIRGPSIFKEYYKEPEKTKAVIDEDGFF